MLVICDVASHRRRTETLTAPLQKPESSHNICRCCPKQTLLLRMCACSVYTSHPAWVMRL